MFILDQKFMPKSLRIRLLFYQNFAMATIVVSLFGCYLIVASNTGVFVVPVLFMKIITNGLIGLIFHFVKQNQLFFFQNLGVSAMQLYTAAFSIDMVLWLSITLLTIAAL